MADSRGNTKENSTIKENGTPQDRDRDGEENGTHEKGIEKENGTIPYQPEKMESRMKGGTQQKKMHTAKQIEDSREDGAGVTDQSSYTKDPGSSKGSNKSSYMRNQEYYSENDAIK